MASPSRHPGFSARSQRLSSAHDPRRPVKFQAMTTTGSHSKLRVVIVGGGVAALETALALPQLAPELTAVTVIAPNGELVYRPMTVGEPFACPRRPPLPARPDRGRRGRRAARRLARVGRSRPSRRSTPTPGASTTTRLYWRSARTRAPLRARDHDRRPPHGRDAAGLIQDIEGGYARSLAFVAPGRMPGRCPCTSSR